jgi:hypothetical protein
MEKRFKNGGRGFEIPGMPHSQLRRLRVPSGFFEGL